MCAVLLFFFFNDTATTEIYTLSLHDALPIHARVDSVTPVPSCRGAQPCVRPASLPLLYPYATVVGAHGVRPRPDRKSTRLNSSHANISYAVFCLKKKKLKNSLLQLQLH